MRDNHDLQNILTPFEFLLSGITSIHSPIGIEFYKSWLSKEFHGEMHYLKEHLPQKEDPTKLHGKAHSVICIAHGYAPHPKPMNPLPGLQIALYAQGEDYHFWFKAKLNQACEALKLAFPNEDFLPFTDSAPLLERDLANRAGLGWFGKNTCLINQKKGSLFFLGEIVTSLKLNEDQSIQNTALSHDFCGKCTRCLDECPTQALIAPKILDSKKCISYLTIESKTVPALRLREQIGSWFYGCDICQTVCPWNQKHLIKLAQISPADINSKKNQLNDDLRFILTASGKKIEKRLIGTPLVRARTFGLRRNALIVIGNLKLLELKPEVEKQLANPRLNELANWTLEKLK